MSDPNRHYFTDNTAGAIVYITFLPAVVYLFLPPYNSRPYVRYHAWQSIFLNIATFVTEVVVGTILDHGAAPARGLYRIASDLAGDRPFLVGHLDSVRGESFQRRGIQAPDYWRPRRAQGQQVIGPAPRQTLERPARGSRSSRRRLTLAVGFVSEGLARRNAW